MTGLGRHMKRTKKVLFTNFACSCKGSHSSASDTGMQIAECLATMWCITCVCSADDSMIETGPDLFGGRLYVCQLQYEVVLTLLSEGLHS